MPAAVPSVINNSSPVADVVPIKINCPFKKVVLPTGSTKSILLDICMVPANVQSLTQMVLSISETKIDLALLMGKVSKRLLLEFILVTCAVAVKHTECAYHAEYNFFHKKS